MAVLDDAAAEVAAVEDIVRSIAGAVHGLLSNLLINIVPGAPAILNALNGHIDDIIHTLDQIVTNIRKGIAAGIQAAVPTVLDIISTFVQSVGHDIHAIVNMVATAEEVFGTAIGMIEQRAGQIEGWLTNAVGSSFGGMALATLKFMEGEHRQSIDGILDHLLGNPHLPDFMKSSAQGLKDRGAPWMALALPIIIALVIQPLAEKAISPAMIWAEQESNKTNPLKEIDPPVAVEAYLKGTIAPQDFYDAMARHGFDKNRSNAIFAARLQRLTPADVVALFRRGEMDQGQVVELWKESGMPAEILPAALQASAPLISEDEIRNSYLRGLIDEPKHDALMKQHGYTPDRIAYKKSLYYMIPGPQDLIHMAIRNVFSPEIVDRFQLFSDFPPTFKQAAAQQGISEDWAKKYWGAHWVVPSNEEGFQMFHRTVAASEDPNADTFTLGDGTKVQNVIGLSTLQLLLREKDTAPYYRHKLTEIAYRPLTRIDVRRMHKVGSLSKAGVERAYLDLGYSPDRAKQLADYVEKLNAGVTKDAAKPILDRMRTRIIDFYVAEKLDLSDVSFALTDIGFSQTETDAFIAEAKLIRAVEESAMVETGIGKLYVDGFISVDDATKRLQAAKVPDTAIAALFRKWNLQVELKGFSAEMHKQRDLTKSEILQALKDGLHSESDTEAALIKLGYRKDESDTLIAIAKFQAARDSKRTKIDAIKATYINGVSERLVASNSLDSIGVLSDQRDAYLAEWDLQRTQRTERIPIATLRDMLKNNYLTEDEAKAHLRRHRYTEADLKVLLDFWLGRKPAGVN